MKKLLIIFVASFCLFINLNNISASNEYMVTEYIEEIFEDGSYIETIIQENIYYSRVSTTRGSKTAHIRIQKELSYGQLKFQVILHILETVQNAHIPLFLLHALRTVGN